MNHYINDRIYINVVEAWRGNTSGNLVVRSVRTSFVTMCVRQYTVRLFIWPTAYLLILWLTHSLLISHSSHIQSIGHTFTLSLIGSTAYSMSLWCAAAWSTEIAKTLGSDTFVSDRNLKWCIDTHLISHRSTIGQSHWWRGSWDKNIYITLKFVRWLDSFSKNAPTFQIGGKFISSKLVPLNVCEILKDVKSENETPQVVIIHNLIVDMENAVKYHLWIITQLYFSIDTFYLSSRLHSWGYRYRFNCLPTLGSHDQHLSLLHSLYYKNIYNNTLTNSMHHHHQLSAVTKLAGISVECSSAFNVCTLNCRFRAVVLAKCTLNCRYHTVSKCVIHVFRSRYHLFCCDDAMASQIISSVIVLFNWLKQTLKKTSKL